MNSTNSLSYSEVARVFLQSFLVFTIHLIAFLPPRPQSEGAGDAIFFLSQSKQRAVERVPCPGTAGRRVTEATAEAREQIYYWGNWKGRIS